MTSFACWLVAVSVENVFRDAAATWALSTPNYGGGRLVVVLGEGVNVVTISNSFVVAPDIAASDL